MNSDIELTEPRAIAIAIANLKTPGPKDLLGTAGALLFLKKLHRHNRSVAEKVGVSAEIVREFLGLLSLPPEVQDRFRRGELRTLEAGRRLRQLMIARPGLVSEAADAAANLSAHEIRSLVAYLLNNKSASVSEGVVAVQRARGELRDEYHVVVVLDENQFRAVRQRASRARRSPNSLVTEVVVDWLKGLD